MLCPPGPLQKGCVLNSEPAADEAGVFGIDNIIYGKMDVAIFISSILLPAWRRVMR